MKRDKIWIIDLAVGIGFCILGILRIFGIRYGIISKNPSTFSLGIGYLVIGFAFILISFLKKRINSK